MNRLPPRCAHKIRNPRRSTPVEPGSQDPHSLRHAQPREVFALGERVLFLDNGQIIAQGTPHQVLSAPQHETVAQLAGFENIFDARVEALHAERGTMTCRLATSGTDSIEHAQLELETPLVRAEVARSCASESAPGYSSGRCSARGLSARNIIAGRLASLEQRDVIVCAASIAGSKWKFI